MMMLNDGRSELWQWDTGRKLTVDADCTQVHFSNKVFGRSIDVDVVDGVAIIPDILLQVDKELTAWAFVGTAENGYTKISKVFKVNKRNKPADYVFTPPEQTSLEEIKEKLDYLESIQDPDAIKNAVEDYLEKNPVEAPVQSVNGKTGGVKLTAEDVGAISKDELQEATNEALAQAKASGEFNGKDGKDGYTPVKGVDYWTAEDKQEIVKEVGAVSNFHKNMTLDYGYDAATGTSYTAIRVYKKKTDGRLQYPFVFAPNGDGVPIYSGLDVATAYGFPLTINAGCGGTFGSPNGTLIQGGVVIQQGPTVQHPTALPLTIDSDGDLWYADADADAADMVANGIVSAVCGFMPIIKDYEAVQESEWITGIDHYTQQAQRQIIGQYANGDYAIITCEGRNFANSPGWTIAQAQSICISLGLKFAYNLDGGGSTSVVIGKKQLNLIYEGATGRKVPAFIVFNGGTVAPGADVPDEPDVPDVPDEPIELPDGYTLLSYVEVDGKQYISSGIPETTDIGVEYAFAPNQNNGTNSSGHMLSSTNIYSPYLRYQGSGARDIIAQRFGNQQKFSYAFADNVKYTVKAYLGGTDDILVNDSFVGTCAKGTATLSATNMLYLFAYGGDINGTRFRASGKFYYMKIYDADGELIRHFVPCANPNAVVGLYDTINEVFYRSASGVDFIYSGYLPEPDVDEDDTYVYPDRINVPRGAYINTGIPETELYTCEYKAFHADLADGSASNASGHILSSSSTFYTFLKRVTVGSASILGKFKNEQGSEVKTIALLPYVIRTEYDGTNMVSSKDGEIIHTVTVGTKAVATNTYYLFAYGGNPSSENYVFTGQFYYLKLFDTAGNLVHHYKPAKRKSDNVYGVLDTVTNTFHTSDTDIAFTGV